MTAHCEGKMVDTNAARGEGPFCIDRAGGLNSFSLAKLCFSGKYSSEEILQRVAGKGGVVAYLNTRDFREVERRIDAGDEQAKAVFDAMVYQIAKEIAAMTIPLAGDTDAIVLTGGMANSQRMCEAIRKRVSYLGRVLVYPGEREMEALAAYANAIEHGELVPMKYVSEDDDV